MKNEVDKNKLIRKIKEFVVFHCEHLFGTSGQETHHTTAHHTKQHTHLTNSSPQACFLSKFATLSCQINNRSTLIYSTISLDSSSNQISSNQIKSITENAHEMTEKEPPLSP